MRLISVPLRRGLIVVRFVAEFGAWMLLLPYAQDASASRRVPLLGAWIIGFLLWQRYLAHRERRDAQSEFSIYVLSPVSRPWKFVVLMTPAMAVLALLGWSVFSRSCALPPESAQAQFGRPVLEPSQGLGVAGIGLVFLLLAFALLEEVYFRARLQPALASRLGLHLGVLLTALVFAFIHLTPGVTISHLFFGAIFGYTVAGTRSVWTGVYVHMIHNLALWSVFSSAGALIATAFVRSPLFRCDIATVSLLVLSVLTVLLMLSWNRSNVTDSLQSAPATKTASGANALQ